MVWTETTREQYDRRQLRYSSECTDEEWSLIEPFMPAPGKVGRPRKWSLRTVWDAIQYIAAAACQWAMLPKDFPPFTTVQHYFHRLRDSGMLDIINEMLVISARLPVGRAAVPLSHPSGHAQADFGEAMVVIGGGERKARFFVLDLPHSDGCYVRAYPAAVAEAWVDGHIHAFAFFGAVPQSIVYDNDGCLVAKILPDGTRKRAALFSGFCLTT